MMTNKHKKVPELRFKGFTDEWKLCALGELSSLRGGFAFSSEKFRAKGVPIVRISNILPTGEIGGDYVFYDEEVKDENYLLPNKAAVLAMSGATTGKVSILDNPQNKKIYQNQRVGYFTKKDSTDYGFVSTLVRSHLFINQLNSVLVAGAQPNVSSRDIDSFEFKVPMQNKEQQKIGLFFANLDHLITLHQRKLDLLKEQKKGFLQKMFPKNGETVPELRFEGFTDAWEQCAATDIFSAVSDKGYSDLPVLSASQELGMIRRNEIGIDIKYDEKSTKNYKRVKPGQFVIHLRSFQGGFAWSEVEGITSPAYTILDFKEPEKQVSKFWKEVLTSSTFIKRLETVTYGIRDGRSISYTDFSTLKFSLPSVKEQIKIGSFFQQLDNNITIQQRKLDLLKEQKKGFLQKMFV